MSTSGLVWCITDAGDIRNPSSSGSVLYLDLNNGDIRWREAKKHSLTNPWLFATPSDKYVLLSSMYGSLELQWLIDGAMEDPFISNFDLDLMNPRSDTGSAVVQASDLSGNLLLNVRGRDSSSRSLSLVRWTEEGGFESVCVGSIYDAGAILPGGRVVLKSGFWFWIFQDGKEVDMIHAADMRGVRDSEWITQGFNHTIYGRDREWMLIPHENRLLIGKARDPSLGYFTSEPLDIGMLLGRKLRAWHEVQSGASLPGDEMIWLLSDVDVRRRTVYKAIQTHVPFSSHSWSSPSRIWFDTPSAVCLVDPESFGIVARYDWSAPPPRYSVSRNGETEYQALPDSPMGSPFLEHCFVAVRQNVSSASQYDLIVLALI